MRKIILFIFLLGISGCSFVFQNFDERESKDLTYGMSKEEVIGVIGKPQKINMLVAGDGEYEVWKYPDTCRPKTNGMNPLGVIYSKVFFRDGKLVQRDKDRVYAQPGHEFLESINPGSGVKAAKITGQKIIITSTNRQP